MAANSFAFSPWTPGPQEAIVTASTVTMLLVRRTLFIDGSNLYGGLFDLLQPGEYIDFAALLAFMERDLPVEEVKFYGTYMRIDPSKSEAHRLRVRAQKAFFDTARNHPKVSFFKGHFSGAGKEKGVDVRLAVDMAVGAATHQYDEAVLMTGDADLKYAVERAQAFGKRVSLAALGSRFPFGIAPIAALCVVYDLGGFFREHVRPVYKGRASHLLIRDLNPAVPIEQI